VLGESDHHVRDATGDSIDERGVDWQRVVTARYSVEQTLRYEYEKPIRNLHHQLIISPRRHHLDQQRLANHIWAASLGPLTLESDEFGNDIAAISVAHVEREIAFSLEATILRDHRVGNTCATGHDLIDPRWTGGRRLTRPNEAISQAAAELRSLHPSQHELAAEIVHFVHDHMTYTKNVTDVFTTAAVAFAQGRGVCQDFAHVAISLARAAGLSARYVSGHLLGEGATHAWVEFLVADRERGPIVLSYDPTYCKPTNFRYIVVAIGRDYDDVPPTSGVFTGASSSVLHGQQRVRLLDVTYAA
jgi:transglutaminase-like putative cysteine protease